MNKKYVKSLCVDCGKKLSKNKYERCKSCSNKQNSKDQNRRNKISLSREGDLNPAKKLNVRKKISKTLKQKYKSGEMFSPFIKGHKINKGRKRSQEYKNKFLGENNPFFGKTHSEESKKKYKEKRKLWKTPTKDTTIEVKIQNFLKKLGIEFFTHQYIKIEHGYQCDILIPSMNLVIECDGDYWHKYPVGLERDHLRTSELLEKGFKVLRLWENEIRVMEINDFKKRLKNVKMPKMWM